MITGSYGTLQGSFRARQVELKEKYIIKLKYKIDKKDNKIDKLEVKVNQLLEDNKTTHKINEEIKTMNIEIINRSKKLELQLNETTNKKSKIFY